MKSSGHFSCASVSLPAITPLFHVHPLHHFRLCVAATTPLVFFGDPSCQLEPWWGIYILTIISYNTTIYYTILLKIIVRCARHAAPCQNAIFWVSHSILTTRWVMLVLQLQPVGLLHHQHSQCMLSSPRLLSLAVTALRAQHPFVLKCSWVLAREAIPGKGSCSSCAVPFLLFQVKPNLQSSLLLEGYDLVDVVSNI